MSVVAMDIGGANIKLAIDDGTCVTQPFALWREPEQLAPRLLQMLEPWPVCTLLVTMTGELCDCFATRQQGVLAILDAAQSVADAKQAALHVWSTRGRFIELREARQNIWAVAAANWHALATYAASRAGASSALLIDIGSTTTDIIPLQSGCVAAQGMTDTQRLAAGELVYLGVKRTPLCALSESLAVDGQPIRTMAEFFATAADVFVLTGDVPENAHDHDTADGQPLTRACAATRVLRMIGSDPTVHTMDTAMQLATQYKQAMTQRLADALTQVTAVHGEPAHFVVSGSGEFFARHLIERTRPTATVLRVSDRMGEQASVAACAAAMIQQWSMR